MKGSVDKGYLQSPTRSMYCISVRLASVSSWRHSRLYKQGLAGPAKLLLFVSMQNCFSLPHDADDYYLVYISLFTIRLFLSKDLNYRLLFYA